MGHIKDIANQGNIQNFPSATFEIAGDVPASQCSEARVEGNTALTLSVPKFLFQLNRFAGWNLTGKKCTITSNPGGNTGTFDIINNTPDLLFVVQDPGDGSPTEFYAHNGGSLILTRNIQSFARYIHDYLYTVSGGLGSTILGSPILTTVANLPPDLAGNMLNYIAGNPADTGLHLILANTLHTLTTDYNFLATQNNISWRVNRPSPFAYTIKGAKLYTNMPSEFLQTACSILFDPIT